jgi:hypothetical protein
MWEVLRSGYLNKRYRRTSERHLAVLTACEMDQSFLTDSKQTTRANGGKRIKMSTCSINKPFWNKRNKLGHPHSLLSCTVSSIRIPRRHLFHQIQTQSLNSNSSLNRNVACKASGVGGGGLALPVDTRHAGSRSAHTQRERKETHSWSGPMMIDPHPLYSFCDMTWSHHHRRHLSHFYARDLSNST